MRFVDTCAQTATVSRSRKKSRSNSDNGEQRKTKWHHIHELEVENPATYLSPAHELMCGEKPIDG